MQTPNKLKSKTLDPLIGKLYMFRPCSAVTLFTDIRFRHGLSPGIPTDSIAYIVVISKFTFVNTAHYKILHNDKLGWTHFCDGDILELVDDE